MLKVLKKIGLIKKDDDSNKPENGDITSKSFGGMGREKLRKDILKHKGMGKAPTPTAAGLALKQKQEVDKATARINKNTNSNETMKSIYGSDSYGSIGTVGITSSSLDKSSTTFSIPLTPIVDGDLNQESFQKIFEDENNQPEKENINRPSLSTEANMTFDNDNNIDSIEIPSDSEIDSLENETLDFPGYNQPSFSNNESSQEETSPLEVNNENKDTIDFIPSFSSELFTIEKTGEKDTLKNTFTLDNQYEKPEGLTLQTESDEFADIPSLMLDIVPTIPVQNKLTPTFFSSRTIAENIHIAHNQDITGKDLEFAQELATIYSEGNLEYVITSLRNHLNQNNGTVPQRFWYMLMDCYQVDQNKVEFEKVAIAFAYLFNTSPPSWFESDEVVKKNVMSGKNIMILEPHFKVVQTEKFKTFLLASKEEKFCRINVSPCKFELSEYVAIEKLYELFKNLRKNKILAVLMGDNNLINFCKSYINPNLSNKMLKQDFLDNEKTFWLLYLEILQWKGLDKEFENLALEFAMKFEISPPGWEKNGVMSLDKVSKLNHTTNDINFPVLDKYLTSNNIDNLLQMIVRGFNTSNKAEIDLSCIDTIDFAAAGSISYQIQELWSNPLHTQKKVIFRYPNEMVLTLLEMVGVTEFVEIFNRKR